MRINARNGNSRRVSSLGLGIWGSILYCRYTAASSLVIVGRTTAQEEPVVPEISAEMSSKCISKTEQHFISVVATAWAHDTLRSQCSKCFQSALSCLV